MLRSSIIQTVDLNTCEGECGVLVVLCKDGIFYHGILRELGQERMEPPVSDAWGLRNNVAMWAGACSRSRICMPKQAGLEHAACSSTGSRCTECIFIPFN